MFVVKTILVAFIFICAAALLSIVYGFIDQGSFTLVYVFKSCFLTGAFIICMAIIRMILPTGLKPDKLTDHSTFLTRSGEKHKEKQQKAFEFLFLGISIIVISGLLQLLLSVIIPA